MPPQRITSIQNPKVREAATLRNRRQRHREGLYLVDGTRELGRALEAEVELVHVFVEPSRVTSALARQLLVRLAEQRVALMEVTDEVFARLQYGDREDPFIGVARMAERDLASLKLSASALVVVLEGVEKPGNLGAVLRSADATGVEAVIAVGNAVDFYNPNVIRASLGTLFSVPVCHADVDELMTWLAERGLKVFAARVDSSQLYAEADFRGPTALVLGSEAEGLSDAWRGAKVTGIRLPMLGRADSLNVSATAAVLFYEALRQRSSG